MSLRVQFRDFNEARGKYGRLSLVGLYESVSVKYNGMWAVTEERQHLVQLAQYVEGDASSGVDDGWQLTYPNGGVRDETLYSDVTFTSVER